ncbi:putative fluoride ion transporter CrcB [Sphingobacterium mizutaii NBRC 14946 = DSM 11724]|uniref:Fluoride-specific ion channel FluC n=2 Tax=Sphingobacterium mizutaii TaxID=1010 RepID=A0AAJ4XA46_9SPHI|nr:fluoride efflux transporter CrcB [Sphingobacterium mizutaii]GEM68850.1 putative fluoride ion transporter CrcB [Sphingobacterium mizutaii NBRC 14946 = DSM 11724]SDK90032.1 CrcB protein [Sphingobacterium mizutaii]SNV47167.1 camphor resistance protein CrcB [Sphingobacterium mizutaii]
MIKEAFIIGAGGAVGSVLRYYSGQFISKNYPSQIPLGTLIVNLLGCLLIGILLGYFAKNQGLSNEWKLLLVTGFCGGYTTFSTFAAENITLIQNQQVSQAILYIGLSVLLGLAAVYFGIMISRLFQ